MWGNLGFDPRLFLIVLDELPKALSAHALTVHIYKQRRLTFGNQTGPDVFYVIGQSFHCSLIQGDNPAFSLAGTDEDVYKRQCR